MEIFNNIFLANTTMAIKPYLISAVCAIFCGLLVAFSSSLKYRISKSFFATLIVLPLTVQTVIIMVNGSVGTGIAVAGAFSLIRFRSVPAKGRDIVSIFVAMTAGLACASGYVGVAILFALIACALIALFATIKMRSDREQELQITIPENLNFTSVFDDVFEKYTKKATLMTVKTTNMGSLFKLTYIIEMKNDSQIREFIDDLRVRNGNLEIAVLKNNVNLEEL